MAATLKALSTYELLERVLLHLPLRHSLLSQKVNKAFYDVVNRSPQIQRALFLAPTSDDSVVYYEEDLNRLPGSQVVGWRDTLDAERVMPMLNPFMVQGWLEVESRPARHRHIDWRPGNQGQWYESKPRGEHGLPIDYAAFLGRLGGSCGFVRGAAPCSTTSPKIGTQSKMFIAHPAMRLLEIEATSIIWAGHKEGYATLRNNTGVRYGQLRSVTMTPRSLFENYGCCYPIFKVVGGGEWRVMAKSVDEITGLEMLRLLDLSNVDLSAELSSWIEA